MIIIYHHNKKISQVIQYESNQELSFISTDLTNLLFELSNKYSNELIIWCQDSLKEELNFNKIPKIFHHKKILASFSVSGNYAVSDAIHYIDQSFFCNPNRKVSFPSYMMSSEIGGIYAEVLNVLENQINKNEDFDYFLCSLAKNTIPLGLFCYSEPNLLINKKEIKSELNNKLTIDFKFIAEHWKKKWLLVLFFNLLIYERKISIFSLINSFFYKRNKLNSNSLDEIEVNSSKNIIESKEFDVIIPTIGRKQYLYDVLKDFSKQTILPKKVIIVEQNPLGNSVSELDYLEIEKFPFEIKHIFTHQAGACNARNLALNEVSNQWIFLADDDIRIKNDFIKNAINTINQLKIESCTVSCLQKNQSRTSDKITQSALFGSGCSFISKNIAKKIKFDTKFEFGFGEDGDFGMQIRNLGMDIIYLSEPEILHLKAPMGGFRTKPKLAWNEEKILPKPSPTVMLYNLKHNSKKQILAYKTMLVFGYYKVQTIKNPIKYIRYFNQQWEVSKKWASHLMNNK